MSCQLLLVKQFINNKLPIDLKDIFVYTSEFHSHCTQNSTSLGLYLPMVCSSNYGINSIQSSIWPLMCGTNSLGFTQKSLILDTTSFNRYLKNYFISEYKLSVN